MNKKEFLKLSGKPTIKFKGNKYLLIGGPTGWAIATRKQYENFLPSYAHLYTNGDILMYGKKIGTYKANL